MKRLLILILPLALACGNETPGPDPVPTPGPSPEPTVAVEPCVETGVGSGDKTVWKGDCKASDTCRNGNDGFFYGTSCDQAP